MNESEHSRAAAFRFDSFFEAYGLPSDEKDHYKTFARSIRAANVRISDVTIVDMILNESRSAERCPVTPTILRSLISQQE